MTRHPSDTPAPRERDRSASFQERRTLKTLTELAPLAIALVVVAGLVWWLLERDSAAGPWLVAAVLLAHGWVHLVFLLPAPDRRTADPDADNPLDMGRSWLIERGADGRLVRRLGVVVAVATFGALAAAALAVLGWLVPAGWWVGLSITGVVGSTVLLLMFFAPRLVLGFAINAGLLALAIQTTWVIPR